MVSGTPFFMQVLFSHTTNRASPFQFSTTYDFDQHGTPPTDLDDAKALAESTDARSSSSVQSSSFLSPAAGAATSLLHVQGSSGCLTGTLPTFTFIPNNHYQTQLLPVSFYQPGMKLIYCT